MPVRRPYLHVSDLPAVIPVFPLTGALLLPRARLPLSIFEPRYLAMVDAAMYGDRVIGMIQPKHPGEDMAKKPPLCSVGCAGRIVEYSETETEEGRYLITLAGIARFRVAREEEKGTPFRQVAADYTAYGGDMAGPADTAISRERLLAALKPYLKEREMKTDWTTLEEAPGETLVNALAMICPFEPPDKQALLEAADLRQRAEVLVALLEIANATSPQSGGKQPIH